MQKIIITGKNGQVGYALVEALTPLCELHAFDSSEFDLSNEAQVRERIQTIRPDIIINAAAYTAVDRAETDEATAFAVNANGPKIIGQEATKVGAVVIHFSSDYVFDGKKSARMLSPIRLIHWGIMAHLNCRARSCYWMPAPKASFYARVGW